MADNEAKKQLSELMEGLREVISSRGSEAPKTSCDSIEYRCVRDIIAMCLGWLVTTRGAAEVDAIEKEVKDRRLQLALTARSLCAKREESEKKVGQLGSLLSGEAFPIIEKIRQQEHDYTNELEIIEESYGSTVCAAVRGLIRDTLKLSMETLCDINGSWKSTEELQDIGSLAASNIVSACESWLTWRSAAQRGEHEAKQRLWPDHAEAMRARVGVCRTERRVS